MKLYVGNFSFDMKERTLRELFEPFGTVSEVVVIMDRETGPVARLWVRSDGQCLGR